MCIALSIVIKVTEFFEFLSHFNTIKNWVRSKLLKYGLYAHFLSWSVRGIRILGTSPNISFNDLRSMQMRDLLLIIPRDLLLILSAFVNSWISGEG